MLTKQQEMLIRHEGMKLKPYLCTAKKYTIAVGRNLEDRGISEDEAIYMLNNDVRDFYNELKRALPWYEKLNDARRAALMSMAFMGVPKLLKFKDMLAACAKGEWATAAKEALDSKWALDVKEKRANEVAAMLKSGEWQK
jgi:lysozyme